MSIADKLQELINSKADMKSAIAEKGVEVEGGLTTYAAAIRKIQQGLGDRFAAIGYNKENTGGFLQEVNTNLDVADEILAEWNSTEWANVDMNKWKDVAVYFPAVDLTRYPSYNIFRFLEWSKLQVVPSLDFTGKTNMNALFFKCKSLKYIGNIIGTESVTNMSLAFSECSSLTSIPYFDTSSATSMHDMFNGCTSLTSIPQLDTSSVSSMSDMFEGCTSLTSIPQLNTSKVTDMYYMFYRCTSLTSIPQLNTSSVTNMGSMFQGCTSLTTIPQLDTSSVSFMSGMFQGCSSLTSIPQLNTSSVINMGSMFKGCNSLTSIPQLNTSSVIDMGSMFEGCASLTSIPQLNTSSVSSMSDMFEGCLSLTSIPLLDCSSITNTYSPFRYVSLNELTDLGGFKNLKVSWDYNFLKRVPYATVESLMNVINNLYDLTANGLSGQTLNFGTTNLNKLTDEQKAVAINKGWTLI